MNNVNLIYLRAAKRRVFQFLIESGVPVNGVRHGDLIRIFCEKSGLLRPDNQSINDWLIELYISKSGIFGVKPKTFKRNKKDYYTYLLSSAWKAFREKALDFYGRVCMKCKSTHRLEVHHKHYKNIFKEELDDVMVLCHQCHKETHKKIRRQRRKKTQKN